MAEAELPDLGGLAAVDVKKEIQATAATGEEQFEDGPGVDAASAASEVEKESGDGGTKGDVPIVSPEPPNVQGRRC